MGVIVPYTVTGTSTMSPYASMSPSWSWTDSTNGGNPGLNTYTMNNTYTTTSNTQWSGGEYAVLSGIPIDPEVAERQRLQKNANRLPWRKIR